MKLLKYKYIIQPTGKMSVPSVVFTTERLLPLLFKDKSLEQLKNVASLPGVEKYALGMPDIHEG